MTETREALKVSVVGLGKLGASTAAALASRGLEVVGVDVNERTVELINEGHAPVSETGLKELIAANQKRLRATTSYTDAVLRSDVTLIIVPTPSDEFGGFSLEYVKMAAGHIADAIKQKHGYHVVTLVSTVLPGACQGEVIPLIEERSGKRCGADFGFCYAPEFIALGSVIRDFLNPDFVLIGEFDQESGNVLADMYRRSCENSPPIERMNIVNAEITKLSVNTYVTTKISFANMLAEICAQLPGADVDAVTNAMGNDRRIGRKYLSGAVSFGGPCFPRDNVALAYLARQIGADASLAEATHDYNESHKEWLLHLVKSVAGPDDVIGVAGLTYRSGTSVLEQAVGMWLAQKLMNEGRQVIVYDKNAQEIALEILNGNVQSAETIQEVVARARVIVLVGDGPDIQALTPGDFAIGTGESTAVIDCWRGCRFLDGVENVNYVAVGIGPSGSNVQVTTKITL